MLYEVMQGVELFRRQNDVLSGLFHTAAQGIQENGTDLERGIGCNDRGTLTANGGSQSGDQFTNMKWLRNVVIRPQLECPNLVVFSFANCQHDDGDSWKISPKALASFHASDSRHVDIKEYYLVLRHLHPFKSFLTTPRFAHGEAERGKRRPQTMPNGRVVFDDEDRSLIFHYASRVPKEALVKGRPA